MKLPCAELETLAARALERAGANPDLARAAARHLVAAEGQGLPTHGLSRVEQYVMLLSSGRHQGAAHPKIVNEFGATCLIDAGDNLAYEAVELALAEVTRRAAGHGVAFVGVTNSGHCGVLGMHVEAIAAQGMVGLAFANTPAGVPAWGGRRALFGVDPVAAAFPRKGADPLVVDFAPTTVVRGKIMLAAQKGEPIPEGWALDREGRPTTDPKAALDGGSLFPIGGAKGAMLSLMIELLAAGLTGARLGFEADGLFDAKGNRPRLGHAFLAIHPRGLAGEAAYLERVEDMVKFMLADEGVRLPGARRFAGLRAAQAGGLEISEALHARLAALAA